MRMRSGPDTRAEAGFRGVELVAALAEVTAAVVAVQIAVSKAAPPAAGDEESDVDWDDDVACGSRSERPIAVEESDPVAGSKARDTFRRLGRGGAPG